MDQTQMSSTEKIINENKQNVDHLTSIHQTIQADIQFVPNVVTFCSLPSTTPNNIIQMIPIDTHSQSSFNDFNNILPFDTSQSNITNSTISSSSVKQNVGQKSSLDENLRSSDSSFVTTFTVLPATVTNLNTNLAQHDVSSTILISSAQSVLPLNSIISTDSSSCLDVCKLSSGLLTSPSVQLKKGSGTTTKEEMMLPLTLTNESNSYSSKYICMSTHDEIEEAIRKHSEETFSHFVVAKKTKAYGSSVTSIDISTKFRIHWQSRDLSATEECAVQIPFDGIPFIYIGEKAYMCHLGRSKTNRLKNEEVLDNGKVKKHRSRITKKQGCSAKVFVKQIAKFPQFQIRSNSEYLRTQTSQKIRKALIDSKGELVHIMQYIATLPDIAEHSNHDIGENVALKEPIDPLIRDKILELSWQYGEGTLVKHIKEILEDFVENTLFKGKTPPSKNRRRFYPSERDISNYIYKSRIISKLSSVEQDHLHLLIEKLKKENEDDKISFYFDTSENGNIKKETIEGFNQKFCFSFQTQDQQRLLKKYGSQVLLTELSKQTINLPFPFFGVFVPTNVDYQLVYCFIVQSRNKDCLKDGMSALFTWNPTWSPKFFIVDFSREQIEAVETLFPTCTALISERSREQSWKIWLNNPVNLSNLCGDKDEVYKYLTNLATSYTEESLNQAALELENSNVWKMSDGLREWFSNSWLSEAKRWVVGYRHDEYCSTVHLKYSLSEEKEILRDSHYIHLKNKKVGEFINTVVTQIVPACYRRYNDRNLTDQENHMLLLKSFDHYPSFLKWRTFTFANHVLGHMEMYKSIEFTISRMQPGIFCVQNKKEPDLSHVVSFGDSITLPSCVCLDWLKYKLPCQHMLAIFNATNWSWDMLSVSYTSNPVYNIDASTQGELASCDEYEVEKQASPKASVSNIDVVKTIRVGMQNEATTSLVNCDVITPLRSECEAICEEISLNLQQANKKELLHKVKLELQFMLNDIKLENSKIPTNKKRVSIHKEIYLDTKKSKLIENSKMTGGKNNSESDKIGDTSSTYDMISSLTSSEPTNLITNLNNGCWIYDTELGIKLSKNEKESISNNQFLTGNIIKNVLNVIRHQFKNLIGLYDPIKIYHLEHNVESISENCKFLQIHKFDGNHWATTFKIDKDIFICCCNLCSKPKVIEQFQHMLSKNNFLSESLLFIERDENEDDIQSCSLYAIAYAIAFAFNILPKSLKFNKTEMRSHLIECLEDMCFSMFPLET